MTNEERDLIAQFIARVGGAPASSGFGSVPSTAPANLPPIDPEADAFIAQEFAKYPEVRYRLTQLAFVQEHALTAAQSRIAELQNALTQARQAAQPAQGASSPWGQQAAAPAPQPSRGFLGTLFGGGNSAPPPPRQQFAAPPQQYAPQPQYGQMPPMMAQQSGTGFLGGALRTAAGVAGGVVAGEALMSMFSGGHGGGLFGGGISDRTGIEQGAGGMGGAWGAPAGAGTDQFDQGGAMKDDATDTGWSAPPQDQGGGWTDTSNVADTSGGWTDTSNVADSGGGGWTDTSDSGGGGWDDTSNT